MRSGLRRVSAVAGVLALLLAGCADDGEDAATTTTTTAGETTTSGDAGGQTLDLTVTEDALDGHPGSIPAGVVTVNLGVEPPANPDRAGLLQGGRGNQ